MVHYLTLAAILAAALALRLYGIDWDRGHFFHPDERFILQFKVPEIAPLWPPDLRVLLDRARSPWNPHWFAYGTFPIYLLKALQQIATALDPTFTGDALRFLGRGMSAVADTGSVLMVYLLGARLYGRRVGLLGAALMALAVLHIQLSHFATFDVLLTFWVLVVLYGCALLLDRAGAKPSLIIGVGFGLALATKVSVLPLILPVLVAYALAARKEGSIDRALKGFALTIGVAAVAFAVAQPYALLDLPTFLADTREQSEMALRMRDLPFTRQYESTPAYVYQIGQLGTWGLGWPLNLASWLGLGASAWWAWRRGNPADLLLLSWVVPYFVLTGAFPVKFMRYLLPFTPVLVLMGARVLDAWRTRLSLRGAEGDVAIRGKGGLQSGPIPRLPRPSFLGPRNDSSLRAWLPTAIILAATAWYALAFTNIYREEHPAVAMSAWIKSNLPAGAKVLREHWEESIPGLDLYRHGELKMYEPDNPAKLTELSQLLASGDYILFYSNRLYGTIPRLPERYPMSTEYYRLLFAGELGYELAHVTQSHPSLLGITLRDDTFSRPGLPAPVGEALPQPHPEALEGLEGRGGLVLPMGYADESFTVYDHPTVLLFRKARPIQAAEVTARLGPFVPGGEGSRPPGLMLSPELLAAQRAGGTWSEMFQPGSLGERAPVLVWLLAVEIAGLLAFPLAHRLFSRFPDRGYLPAKALGLLLVAYPVWLAASLHVAPFTGLTVFAAYGIVAVLAVVVWWRDLPSLASTLRTRRRYLVAMEVLFLAAFLVFVFIRSLNPDLWHASRGGEKPMDLAYLNAILRSTYMPPYDPWLSGGYINYYYFGQFIVAALIKVTGVVPYVAYNLAVPTVFAMLVGGAFSVGAALGSGRPILAGAATALGVAIVGNLDGAFQLLEGLQKAAGVDIRSTIPGVAGLIEAAMGLINGPLNGGPDITFDYWRSRAMGSMDQTFIDPTVRAPSLSITEFPYFTLLFADLHAHLIALPFTVLALAFAVQAALGRPGFLARLAFLAVLGLVLGALRWTNSWDFPTYFAVAGAAILIGELSACSTGTPARARRQECLRHIALAGLELLAVFGFSWLFFRPFQQAYELFFSGGLAPSPETTPPGIYLRIHGLFLFLLVSFLLWELLDRFGGLGVFRVPGVLWRWRHRPLRLRRLYRVLVWQGDTDGRLALLGVAAVLLFQAVLAALGAANAGLLVLFLATITLLGVTELRHPTGRGPAYLLALTLAGAAAGLGLLVDVVKFDIPGEVQRMNNVFKLYLQAWVLYAVSAAFALWWVLRSGPPRWWRWTAAALGAAVLVYPAVATSARVADRFESLPPTLDGTAYMLTALHREQERPIDLKWDHDAIQWLQANVAGSPVVLEASTPIYRWGSRISIYTGLPTVLGWDWHQSQQRWDYREEIERRKNDVTALYSEQDPARAAALLKKYDVRYVYIGQLERVFYPEPGLRKFDGMAAQGQLRLVYQNPEVKIYEVAI